MRRPIGASSTGCTRGGSAGSGTAAGAGSGGCRLRGLRIRGAAALGRLLERDEEVVAVRRGVRGDLAVDLAGRARARSAPA